jgi:hypothetical protein
VRVGAALPSHGRGHRFETCHAHFAFLRVNPVSRLTLTCRRGPSLWFGARAPAFSRFVMIRPVQTRRPRSGEHWFCDGQGPQGRPQRSGHRPHNERTPGPWGPRWVRAATVTHGHRWSPTVANGSEESQVISRPAHEAGTMRASDSDCGPKVTERRRRCSWVGGRGPPTVDVGAPPPPERLRP